MTTGIGVRSVLASLGWLLFCSGALAATSNFDHFRLQLLWPGSRCTSVDVGVCCLPYTGDPAVDFIVIGFQTWRRTVRLTKCSDERFYVNAIKNDVRSGLIKRWTNLGCPSASPQTMWEGTWGMSGTCSGMNETSFFGAGYNLAVKANVLGALRKYGITPANNRQYPIASVRKALQESIGKKVVVTCNKNAFESKSQIDNVWVCANKEGTAFVDCPHTDSSCPQSVMLPAFTADMLIDSTLTQQTTSTAALM